MLSVTRSLANKGILITGATGFVGKVLFEKILRDVPDIKKIFLLVRGNADERVAREILDSKIFTYFNSIRSDLKEYARIKVVAVRGDVQQPGIGLSPEDLRMLQEEVNVVVHCAATVDFKERLDSAVRQNVLGTLQLFETSKTFKRLDAFIHVSTAYVNSDRQGEHKEELPPLNFDPEEMVQLILQMDPAEIEKATPGIIGSYPNTYTFTKAIAERILDKRRGNTPVALVRPTIIGASLREPMPGWIDSVSAVAAAILFAGLGVIHFLKGDYMVIADIVPIDSVVNVILGAIAHTVGRNGLSVYHAGTSKMNPVRWYEAARWVSVYWRHHNVEKRVDPTPLHFRFYKSDLAFKSIYFLKYELPTALYSGFASTLGTEKQKKNAELYKKTTKSILSFTDAFGHFTTCHWVFDVTKSHALMNSIVEEEKNKFYFGIQEIDWEQYIRFFCYGMQRFVLHEDVNPPTEVLKIDLVSEPRIVPEEKASMIRRMFPDAAWAFSRRYHQNVGIDNLTTMRTPEETRALILRSKRVQDVIAKLAKEENSPAEEIEKQAQQMLERMAHTLTLKIVRALGFFLRKVWKKIYRGIHVEEKGIDMVRASLRNGPLLLIPTHRSYVDFLLISYIFYEYDLPMPHIAAGEDFLGIMFVNWVFRNSGAFFLRRSFKNDPLYLALFTEYVQRLVSDWSPIEFFIEGKRSRTGKTLHPKFGLLSIAMEPFLNKKVPDLTIVPISISYEKVVEAEIYTNELLGEQKTKESLKGLIGARRVLDMNFGRINIICNPPISAKEFIEKYPENQANNNNSVTPVTKVSNKVSPFDPYHNEEDRKRVTSDLAYTIARSLNKGLVITSTALVATVMLTYRKGLSFEDLVSKVNWLREDVTARGGSVAFEGTTTALVNSGLQLLSSNITKVRNHYVPAKSAETGKQKKSILVLDYYRNQLLHLYAEDGIIASVLLALQPKDKVKREELLRQSKFVKELLWLEFVNDPAMSVEGVLAQTLDSMIKRGILAVQSDATITVTRDGEGPITFLSHMFWPLIDSYWVAAISLFSLQPNLKVQKKLLLTRMQWIAEKMYSEGKIHYYESCSMEILLNTLERFEDMKLVNLKEEESRAPVFGSAPRKKRPARLSPRTVPENPFVSLLAPYEKEEILQKFIEHIAIFRKPTVSYSKNTAGSTGMRSAVITEFPVLAKL